MPHLDKYDPEGLDDSIYSAPSQRERLAAEAELRKRDLALARAAGDEDWGKEKPEGLKLNDKRMLNKQPNGRKKDVRAWQKNYLRVFAEFACKRLL